MALHISESEFRDRLCSASLVFCKYDKEYGYLQCLRRGEPARFYKFGDDSNNPYAPKVSVDDPRLSLANLRAGFVNHDRHTYLLRLSNGLGFGYSSSKVEWSPRGTSTEMYNSDLNGVLSSRNKKCILESMFLGVYPKYKEALDLLNTGHRSVAFDRDLCVVRSLYKKDREVYHRDRLVGHCDPKSGKLNMFSGPLFKLVGNKIKRHLEVA